MTVNREGLEYSFVESWDGWDQVGAAGDLAFYKVKLLPKFEHLVPEGTTEIMLTLLMSESLVQFDFFNEDGFIGWKAFSVSLVLGEEINEQV